ncbi:hypothetical protein C5O19_11645 [Siphonobacter curvatus]|uniref:Uncharacterized protein n=1 Tax=Siphonobacter curvatus TaxID=2094562 RepID=A0A2S7IRD2_9BACT|nr:hypothetical protein C5O19_11645 [Siphonobacter curvatus]
MFEDNTDLKAIKWVLFLIFGGLTDLYAKLSDPRALCGFGTGFSSKYFTIHFAFPHLAFPQS